MRADGPPSWYGSIIEAQQDGSGLQYKRNRYYDPQTGRFTQEDPIGLAGGLNAYGFAGGDPVDFSDPFGLCPVCIVVQAAEAVGGGAVVLGTAAAAVSTATAFAVTEMAVAGADAIATTSVGMLESAIPKVHGNSLVSLRATEGYSLRDRDTGAILKYGETSMGKGRYSKTYLKEHNADMVVEAKGSKKEMHAWQHEKILEYKAANDGNRPSLNKSDY